MQIRIPDRIGEHARRIARLVAREPFQRRSWVELGYFLVGAGLAGLAALSLAALGLVGLLLTVALVGVPVLAAGLRAARGLGRWQRGLALHVLGLAIPEPSPFRRQPGAFGWLRAAFADRSAWRTVAYFAAKVPLVLFGTWFALSLWAEAVLGLASPFTGGGAVRFGPLAPMPGPGPHEGFLPSLFSHLGAFLTGAVLLFVAPWAMRLVVSLDRVLMVALLGPSSSDTRVRSLEASRAKTLGAAAQTLQRIERDLHDGTQAQLVALAMRLGQAKEKLDAVGTTGVAADDRGDLDAARRLVDEAHRGAKEAITDLRDLARGIHPPALDTGLENALTTLAARSPVPATVSVAMQSRPTVAIEAISYFCAAELLANVAQHARAGRASLTCTQHGPWLRIVVRDDGCGGAAVVRAGSSSSGLAGLADRVEAVDGRLTVASPAGGPTAVIVDLPMRA